MHKCDLYDDYVEKYQCEEKPGNIEFDIDNFLNERLDSKASKIELEYIKQDALDNLNDHELRMLREYLKNLSNTKWRDDRLQLRELSISLYRHKENNYKNPNDYYNSDYDNIEKYKEKITFEILWGYINRNPLWWFADWKYVITNYNIQAISRTENIYKVRLNTVLKKWHLRYNNNDDEIQFKYDKSTHRLIIKFRWRYHHATIYPHHNVHRRNSNWKMCRQKWQILKIHIKNLHMKIFFKAD